MDVHLDADLEAVIREPEGRSIRANVGVVQRRQMELKGVEDGD